MDPFGDSFGCAEPFCEGSEMEDALGADGLQASQFEHFLCCDYWLLRQSGTAEVGGGEPLHDIDQV